MWSPVFTRSRLAGIGALAMLAAVAVMAVAFPSRGAQPAGEDDVDVEALVTLLEFVIDADEATARQCLGILTEQVQSGEVRGKQLAEIRSRLSETISRVFASRKHPLRRDVQLLAASWGDSQAVAGVKRLALDRSAASGPRSRAFDALASHGGPQLLTVADQVLGDPDQPERLQASLLSSLGRLPHPEVADVVLGRYGELRSELQPKVIELLTARPAWSKALIVAIGNDQIPAAALNVNQVSRLLASRDSELVALVRSKWGSVRTERNPQREAVIAEMRQFLAEAPGDPMAGQRVFDRVCGQCHKIYGRGQEVGPDITRNGRASFDQLLSNVFDPSLVIGASYQARTVVTADGRILTGLLAEDNEQRIVLKTQGGKIETIPREDVDELLVSKLSLMPEGLEKQLKPDELADLFAFLALDRPPEDETARPIPGTPTRVR